LAISSGIGPEAIDTVLRSASAADGWIDMPMARVPLTLRALVLVPLLAVGVDLARATIACGPQAQSCLEAAGRGWLGAAGPVLLVLYATALALAVGALAHGRSLGGGAPGLLRSWAVGTAGVAAVCGGQALLAGALGDAGTLGGGWAELVAFCAVAGLVLAVTLRIAPAAAELVRSLRPPAPRPAPVTTAARAVAPPDSNPSLRFALATRQRGPPAPLD
jgi:hypothetical protein